MTEEVKSVRNLIPEEGIVKDLPFEMYLLEPAVSSSMIRYIADGKTPAHVKAKFIDGKIKYDSDDLEFGRKAHLILLEPEKFRSRHVVMPVFTGRTKDGRESAKSGEAKEKRERWLKALPPEAIVVEAEEAEALTGMLNQLLKHSKIPHMLNEGVSELSLFWIDKETGTRCKARLDYLSYGKRALIDYKTTRDASHDSFSKSVVNFGYQIQLSHYLAGCQALNLPVEDTLIIAQEKEYPYLPVTYFLNHTYLEDGEARRRSALNRISACYKSGEWPGYDEKVHELIPPNFLAFKEVL